MKLKRLNTLRLLLVLGIFKAAGVCDDRVSVVILNASSPTESVQLCQDTIETKYQTVRNLKINGKSEIRALPVPNDGHPQPVTHQEYEHAKPLNIKDLTQLELREGVLYGLTTNGATMLL